MKHLTAVGHRHNLKSHHALLPWRLMTTKVQNSWMLIDHFCWQYNVQEFVCTSDKLRSDVHHADDTTIRHNYTTQLSDTAIQQTHFSIEHLSCRNAALCYKLSLLC